MNPIFSSSRFHFRELTPDDASVMFDLHSNEAVMRYVGMPLWQLRSESLNYILKNERSYRTWGFGRWAVIDKDSGEFFGLAGLLLDEQRIDLGYRFFPEYWGKQIATEAARAVLSYGFNTLSLPTIEARVALENLASEKVLTKIGMQYMGDTFCMGIKAKKYRIDNPRKAGV